MRPVLEDDALLYSLDDISEGRSPDFREQEDAAAESQQAPSPEYRIRELEEELERIRGQFAAYQMVVRRSLDNQLETLSGEPAGLISNGREEARALSLNNFREAEAGYFTSYSYNGM